MYDVAIIGGGFYGCSIALYLAQNFGNRFKKIIIFERENALLQRASFANQARVHNGYHYPRSLLTAYSSIMNFERFCTDFTPAIKNDFEKYYAISKFGSKVSARQFYHIFTTLGAPISVAPKYVKTLFNSQLTEEVFKVKEFAFDANILRQILEEKLSKTDIEISFNTHIQRVEFLGDKIALVAQNQKTIESKMVLNCSYGGLNDVLKNSNLPPLNLKAEITEMCLVRLSNELDNLSFTMMDGNFFSFMPFPAYKQDDKKCLYTLSHVRYTPHFCLLDSKFNNYDVLQNYHKQTHFDFMLRDCARFVPSLAKCEFVKSLFEVKIVSVKNEDDDGRPIIFTPNFCGINGFANILGGKIDNIYDVLKKFDETHFWEE